MYVYKYVSRIKDLNTQMIQLNYTCGWRYNSVALLTWQQCPSHIPCGIAKVKTCRYWIYCRGWPWLTSVLGAELFCDLDKLDWLGFISQSICLSLSTRASNSVMGNKCCYSYIEGILPKGPYLPCVSMAGRVLLAGCPRYRIIGVTYPYASAILRYLFDVIFVYQLHDSPCVWLFCCLKNSVALSICVLTTNIK